MKEIKMQTTVAQLLNDYEGMKDVLISINPKFKKLNNPILRRTLAKLSTVKQVAIIGGMDAQDLLNRLRISVGQEPLVVDNEDNIDIDENRPKWAEQKPTFVLNVNEVLNNNKNPLAESFKILKRLKNDEILQIISDFRPEPLIGEFQKQGYEVISYTNDKNTFYTMIKDKIL